ncbi:hypothetical protein BLNAU_24652 [Blattamonas nauphoetae]|uniref:Secreted protein n=1 Tax=Blattamonas nauphoetae TaxID=2049346 RepID=A0ABQ9WLT6_9EUKA|nr:hypothetical protein BLNAU_24652 [Blattamonas nauphoetae]
MMILPCMFFMCCIVQLSLGMTSVALKWEVMLLLIFCDICLNANHYRLAEMKGVAVAYWNWRRVENGRSQRVCFS